MKLINQFSFNEISCFVGQIEDHEEQLSNLELFDYAAFLQIQNEVKKNEWIASRKLIKLALESKNIKFEGLFKDQFGKLFLRNSDLFLSITHSLNYVAVVLASKPCGVDLEKITPKFFKVSPRVLNESELKFVGDDLNKHCILWSAKEAIYKLHGKKNVDFRKQIEILSFVFESENLYFEGLLKLGTQQRLNLLATKFNETWLTVCG